MYKDISEDINGINNYRKIYPVIQISRVPLL